MGDVTVSLGVDGEPDKQFSCFDQLVVLSEDTDSLLLFLRHVTINRKPGPNHKLHETVPFILVSMLVHHFHSFSDESLNRLCLLQVLAIVVKKSVLGVKNQS